MLQKENSLIGVRIVLIDNHEGFFQILRENKIKFYKISIHYSLFKKIRAIIKLFC